MESDLEFTLWLLQNLPSSFLNLPNSWDSGSLVAGWITVIFQQPPNLRIHHHPSNMEYIFHLLRGFSHTFLAAVVLRKQKMFSSLSKCKIIIHTDVLKIALPLGFSLGEGRRGTAMSAYWQSLPGPSSRKLNTPHYEQLLPFINRK